MSLNPSGGQSGRGLEFGVHNPVIIIYSGLIVRFTWITEILITNRD